MKISSLLTSAAALALSLVVRPDRKLPKHRVPAKPVTFIRPAAFVEVAPVEVKAPKPLLVEDIKGAVPSVDAIEKAARSYEAARLEGNAAERIKNKAKKILAETPDGTYGLVTVERFASSRQTADLDAIRAIFEANGLGDVPMKTNAASITLTFAEANALADEQLAA
jgi:hypothetical protein